MAVAAVSIAMCVSGCGGAGTSLRIGVLSDCQGNLSPFYEPTLSTAELPLLERGARPLGDQPSDGITDATVAGRTVRLVFGCAGTSSSSAVAEARRLVEREGVDIVVGPQLTEAEAVKEYAKREQGITFVAAAAAPQSSTLRDPASNFFSFYLDETQAAAGLGAYAFRHGWRRAVIVGQDEAINWGYAAGIVAEFCSLGGDVVKRVWVSQETNPSSLVADVPKHGIDGIFFLPSQGPQLLALMKGLPLLHHGLAGRVVGAGPVFVDYTQSLGQRLDGAVYSTGGTDSDPGTSMAVYTAHLAKAFPKVFSFVGLGAPGAGFGLGYYNAMQAALTALGRVGGDLSHGERRYMAALAKVELDAPNGHVRLDANHQAVAPNYLNRLVRNRRGKLTAKTFETIPDVEQTFGGLFSATSPPPGRTSPACRHGNPPPWAAR
jgi:branched-chain amino acid transport system substrate-binding protein